MTESQSDFIGLSIMVAGFASHDPASGLFAFAIALLLCGASQRTQKKRAEGGDTGASVCHEESGAAS